MPAVDPAFVPPATTPFSRLTPKGATVWGGGLGGGCPEPSGWTQGSMSGHGDLLRICLPTVHAPPLKEGHWNDKSAWSWVI